MYAKCYFNARSKYYVLLTVIWFHGGLLYLFQIVINVGKIYPWNPEGSYL